MLQQTGVDVVIPYFNRWIARFPTVGELARADEAEVLGYWQGLGYYRRARNLLAGAKIVAVQNPQTPDDWIQVPFEKLPGIGRYTAAAIRSISLGQPAELVDGNVERVYCRLAADIAEKPQPRAWKWAEQEMRSQAPGDWNQALMELGATICTPKNPRCELCPVRTACKAHNQGIQNQIPRPKTIETVAVEFWVWAMLHDGKLALRQAPNGEWWHGLWTCPYATTSQPPSGELTPLGTLKTVVTKHKITLHLTAVKPKEAGPNLNWVPLQNLDEIPVPSWQKKLHNLIKSNLLLSEC